MRGGRRPGRQDASQIMDVDLDEPGSWPDELRGAVEGLFRGNPDVAAEAQDRPLSLADADGDGDVLGALDGHALIAFHCTRFTAEEVATVRAAGLRKLSRELVEDRIAAAEDAGHLSADEASGRREKNVYAIENTTGRIDQVCFVIGRSSLLKDATGLWPLLASWGGESINGWPLPPRGEDPVRAFGSPTIVVARIRPTRADTFAPPLACLFLAKTAGQIASGDVFSKSDVPARDVIAIWQPGSPEYDRHPDLPGS